MGCGRAAFGLAVCLSAASANASDCPQERAVYRDADNAYELAFAPTRSDAEANTHRFSLKVIGTKLVLDGYVMGSRPINRSNGVIFYKCPEGDVTGKDLEACTVWQGVVYGHSEGHIDLLPPEGANAADEILLPDLGPSIRLSAIWGDHKAATAPWDVLDFKECAK